ncbi:MAG: hypothetical protein WC878_04955 [Candidatus Paceibacterota bacterium]|jgi:hypothetical protein
MKQDYVPDWPTYTEKDIEKRNKLIDTLCVKIQPLAREMLVSMCGRQQEKGKPFDVESDFELLCTEIIAEAISKGETEFAEKLKTAKNQEPCVFDENDWFETRSGDLARCIAGFWFNYELDEGKTTDSEEKKLKALFLIVSRFGLNEQDAGIFLSKLYALMR